MSKKQDQEENSFHAKSLKEWSNWLSKNSETKKNVWLVQFHKSSGKPTTSYEEARDEALCFGWVDSVRNKRDAESSFLYFAKRNPKSNWSKVNKDRVEQLIQQKRMKKSGLAMVELAKKTGTWNALDLVEELSIPSDLKKALEKNKKANEYFSQFPKSTKRGILEWILNAKKEETRLKRIEETVQLAEKNIRANQYRQPKGA